MQAIILNSDVYEEKAPEQAPDAALALSLAELQAEFMNTETGRVDYGAIGQSKAYRDYKRLASGLKSFNLSSLQGQDERIAFWINIYNASVVHGVIELGLSRSIKEIPRFFDRVRLDVGGFHFSLSDIEHGVLRGNRRPPYRLRKPFKRDDSRLPFAVRPMDFRIHFALVCGAKSCPPVGFYESDQIEQQLELAAGSFINSSQVQIHPGTVTVSISRIFKWYKVDFGGSKQAVLGTIMNYLDEGVEKTFLLENRDRVRIQYQPYDWDLNG